jgi:hypothetical protein
VKSARENIGNDKELEDCMLVCKWCHQKIHFDEEYKKKYVEDTLEG